jgi:hypothetical protein
MLRLTATLVLATSVLAGCASNGQPPAVIGQQAESEGRGGGVWVASAGACTMVGGGGGGGGGM